jgi:CBS domain-containing protein
MSGRRALLDQGGAVTIYIDEPIQDLVRPGVASVPPETTLREVASVLTEEEVGLLVVFGPEGMLGVISERDIAAALADGADPDEVWASDVMTDEPICLDQDDTVLFAANSMIDGGVRHLPIMASGQVMGMVSIRDVLRALTEAVRLS